MGTKRPYSLVYLETPMGNLGFFSFKCRFFYIPWAAPGTSASNKEFKNLKLKIKTIRIFFNTKNVRNIRIMAKNKKKNILPKNNKNRLLKKNKNNGKKDKNNGTE